jgi:hypothetical protein
LIFFADAYENGYIMDGHLTPEYIDENGMYDGQTYDGQPYDGHGQPFMPYGYVFLEIDQSETRIAYGGHICEQIETK